MNTARICVTVLLGALSVALLSAPAHAGDRDLGTDGTRVTVTEPAPGSTDWWIIYGDRDLGTDGTRVTTTP